MLSEEANEYFMATEPAHKLQELADFCFVMTGTKAKYLATPHESFTSFSIGVRGWSELYEWMETVLEALQEDLQGILGCKDHELDWYIVQALEIVTEANEAKPLSTKDGGKTPKGDNYVSPLEKIKDFLNAEG
jgi:hypothetical protein